MFFNKKRGWLLLLALFLGGCSQADAPMVENTAVPPTAAAAVEPTAAPAQDPTAESESPTDPPPPTPEPTSAAAPVDESDAAGAVAMSSEARLIASFAQPPTTETGEPLILLGQVLDVNGEPVLDAVVEIWQTDASGVYDHPQDPDTDSRDLTFQFYGSTAVDLDGYYAFRTLVPGRYEPRPRHIHFKVKQGDHTLLTSQFYFSDDVAEVEGEGMFQAVGESGDLLLLQLVQGDGTLLANGRIVVDTGLGSGELPLTPPQGEGPYYPVADVSSADADLLVLP